MDNQQASVYKIKRIQHGGDINHPEFPHAKFAGYKAGCRCESCVQANRDYKRIYTKNLRGNNENYAEAQREDKRKYRKTDKGRALYNSMNAKHIERKKLQTPINCNHNLLRLIYEMCPKGYHVDHIIPLSKNGLHSPENLQYLPSSINIQKSNSLEYDYLKYSLKWQNLIDEAPTTRD